MAMAPEVCKQMMTLYPIVVGLFHRPSETRVCEFESKLKMTQKNNTEKICWSNLAYGV